MKKAGISILVGIFFLLLIIGLASLFEKGAKGPYIQPHGPYIDTAISPEQREAEEKKQREFAASEAEDLSSKKWLALEIR